MFGTSSTIETHLQCVSLLGTSSLGLRPRLLFSRGFAAENIVGHVKTFTSTCLLPYLRRSNSAKPMSWSFLTRRQPPGSGRKRVAGLACDFCGSVPEMNTNFYFVRAHGMDFMLFVINAGQGIPIARLMQIDSEPLPDRRDFR